MTDEIVSLKKITSLITDVEDKLTHLDFSRKHIITEVVESYKKHKPL